jgi:hypothetical protein
MCRLPSSVSGWHLVSESVCCGRVQVPSCLGTPDRDHVPRDHADRPAGNQGGKVDSAVAAGVSGLGETQRRESQRELLALQSVWRDRAILRRFGGCTGAVDSRISGCICRCVTRVPCPVPPTHSPRPPRLPAGMKGTIPARWSALCGRLVCCSAVISCRGSTLAAR